MDDTVRIKKTFFQFLAEMFLIVFSVFLGLYLSDQLEGKKEEEKTHHALISISEEIKWNKEFVEGRVAYYKILVKELDSLGISEAKPDTKAPLKSWKGLRPPLLKDAAFQTAVSAQLLARMDFKTAEQISLVYSFQSLYMRAIHTVMDNFFDMKVDNKLKIKTYMKELAGMGGELVKSYDGLTIKLDSVITVTEK
ncbi:MAG: hypothetical protein L6Q47_12455 [Ignavibacteriaceae bacterium]|nr:hypothetical protein [Ignavibacteriaceae bacterium]